MSNRDNLNIRLNYRGGANQQDRMNADKLKSLKKALLYSYQAATAILSDGREFRCLINPNKLSLDLDNKILSIPFKDIRVNIKPIPPTDDSETVTPDDGSSNEGVWEDMEDLVAVLALSSEGTWEDMEDLDSIPEDDTETDIPETDDTIAPNGEEIIGIKEGDVICWKENGSHWIVYLRRLEETAYFRADIRRCRYELTLGNGSKYWVYVRGPVEQSILWSQGGGNYYNKLNYTLILYVTQNEETLKYFNRFKKVMINNQPWEVQAVDSISTPGIIEMTLKETYNNTIETNIEKAVQEAEKQVEVPEQENVYIHGLDKVYPYDICKYEIRNYNGTAGTWSVKNMSRKNMVKILELMEGGVELSVITGKSGTFTLVYEADGTEVAALNITVGSL